MRNLEAHRCRYACSLAEAGITTRDDLAELAVDELIEINLCKRRNRKSRHPDRTRTLVYRRQIKGVQMSNTTVEQFAAELKRLVEDLLKQLKEAMSGKNSGDSLTLDDKQLLNAYLTKKNGGNGGTISIRRTKTEVSTVDGVKVETRKRGRTVNIPLPKNWQHR